jgi:hypothetical protein
MKLINLTAHSINICNKDGKEVLIVPSSGKEARIRTQRALVATLEGIEFYHIHVSGEPYLKDVETGVETEFLSGKRDTYFIVSGLFRSYFDRLDLYQPGELLRDDDGNPIGCVGLSR